MRAVVQKRRRGDDPSSLTPTYVIELELTQAEFEAVTNNTERAAYWRQVQDAIAAFEAGN